MKIVRRGALPVGGDSGLPGDPARPGRVRRTPPAAATASSSTTSGRLPRARPLVRRRGSSTPLRVVIDTANGMGGPCPHQCSTAPYRSVRCFFEPDGLSRTTSRTPCCPRTASSSSRRSIEEPPTSASPSTAMPTGFFVDYTGEFVPATSPRRCSPSRCSRKSRTRKGLDVRASGQFRDTIEHRRRPALVNRVGHASSTPHARGRGGFRGRGVRPYYFREFTQADSGVIPFLLMLELISRRGQPLSQILARFRDRYHLTGELNTPSPTSR